VARPRPGLAALCLGLFWSVCGGLSPRRAARLGGGLLALLGPHTRKHTPVLANLRQVLPELDTPTLQKLARCNWWHLGATLAEYPHLAALGGVDHLRVEGEVPGPGPHIFITAHLGNWELAVAAVQRRGMTIDVVYNPQGDAALDAQVHRARQAMGCGLIAREGALRALFKSLGAGRSVGLLMDYRVAEAPLVPLLGRPAATTTAPAWLAARTGAALVPVSVTRLADGSFEARFHPAVARVDSGNEKADLLATTAAINQQIGALIAAHPEQWWCTKRRWPKRKG